MTNEAHSGPSHLVARAFERSHLASAVWQGWPLLLLLWPYWVQSVVIGYFARRRILALERFSTAGLLMNDQPVSPTPKTQRDVANFFVLHFGGFHLAYFIFLANSPPPRWSRPLTWFDWIWVLSLAIPFAVTHRQSHHEHVERDLAGTTNIGTLMFTALHACDP